MSYRTVKRVLGETSLERKCRWWFGLSLVVLLTLSFTWYGRQTDKLVDDRIKTLSEELWRAGWQKLHIEGMAQIEKPAGPTAETDEAKIAYDNLAASSVALGREFEWHALLPVTRDQLKAEYQNRADELSSAGSPREAVGSGLVQHLRQAIAGRRRIRQRPGSLRPSAVRTPIKTAVASTSIINQCMPTIRASIVTKDSERFQRRYDVGDLMAVVRVTIDDQETVDALVTNRAGLWMAAVVVGFLLDVLAVGRGAVCDRQAGHPFARRGQRGP